MRKQVRGATVTLVALAIISAGCILPWNDDGETKISGYAVSSNEDGEMVNLTWDVEWDGGVYHATSTYHSGDNPEVWSNTTTTGESLAMPELTTVRACSVFDFVTTVHRTWENLTKTVTRSGSFPDEMAVGDAFAMEEDQNVTMEAYDPFAYGTGRSTSTVDYHYHYAYLVEEEAEIVIEGQTYPCHLISVNRTLIIMPAPFNYTISSESLIWYSSELDFLLQSGYRDNDGEAVATSWVSHIEFSEP